MPTTFHEPPPEVAAAVRVVMENWHPRLFEAGVRVGVLFAANSDGDPIKHGGYPAAAKIKPTSLKQRHQWPHDAELLIDESVWDELEDARRVALLDHELSHLDTVPLKGQELRDAIADGGPRWKLDDLGRPKLRSVNGDWNVGDAFNAVIARHGWDAIEYRNIDHAKRSADLARKKGEEDRDATEAA
jgi:hypothetical protein